VLLATANASMPMVLTDYMWFMYCFSFSFSFSFSFWLCLYVIPSTGIQSHSSVIDQRYARLWAPFEFDFTATSIDWHVFQYSNRLDNLCYYHILVSINTNVDLHAHKLSTAGRLIDQSCHCSFATVAIVTIITIITIVIVIAIVIAITCITESQLALDATGLEQRRLPSPSSFAQRVLSTVLDALAT
jgi:hypothetical protein